VLHRIIAEHAPEIREYQAEAARVRTGWLYVIDGRKLAPDGVAHQEDILGALAVEDGTIVAQSYTPNDAYRVFMADGVSVSTSPVRQTERRASNWERGSVTNSCS
jgi:hypothetical protein